MLTAEITVVAVLLLIFYGCARISAWHRKESSYWYAIDLLVRVDPSRDEYYRPLLMWTREHKPSLLGRARGWKSPELRRAAA